MTKLKRRAKSQSIKAWKSKGPNYIFQHGRKMIYWQFSLFNVCVEKSDGQKEEPSP